jgi:hypothetical protein
MKSGTRTPFPARDFSPSNAISSNAMPPARTHTYRNGQQTRRSKDCPSQWLGVRLWGGYQSLFWLLAVWQALPGPAAARETWAERLGYPADRPVVILYGNHMGAAYETNAAGKELLEEGLLASVGAMVPCPWFEDFAQWCREHHRADVGICLTLNSPSSACRWRPLLGPDAGSSLADADGYYWSTPRQLALRADAAQVKRELVMQIERARAAGLQPTHLIPALGSLFLRPDLLQVYLELSERYWLPAVLVELTPEHIEQFQLRELPFTEETRQMLSRHPLPKLDDIVFVPDADSYGSKRDALLKQVEALRPGLIQIIFSPAEKGAALAAVTERWQQLVWDRQLLRDARIRQALQERGVVQTDWRTVMDRFSTRQATRGDDP